MLTLINKIVLQVTSQHPYAEAIGKPYVWTIDMHNSTDVERALTAILNQSVRIFKSVKFTFLFKEHSGRKSSLIQNCIIYVI